VTRDLPSPISLAVVVPTRNEADNLPGLFASLAAQTAPADRVVVADGGSADDTAAVARGLGAEVVVAPGRGRGGQVAAAVAGITADAVLVAHGDMALPPDALASIRRWLADHPACPGGCLGHRFDRRTLALRVVEWLDRRRARRGLAYGDQGQFFRTAALGAGGGFPDQSIMEDVELSRRLLALGPPAYLDRPVTVSARRFERDGWARAACANWRLRRRYRRGGPAACRAIHAAYYRGAE